MFKNISLVSEASRHTEMKSKDEVKVHFRKLPLVNLKVIFGEYAFPQSTPRHGHKHLAVHN